VVALGQRLRSFADHIAVTVVHPRLDAQPAHPHLRRLSMSDASTPPLKFGGICFQFLRNFHQLTAFEQPEMILYAALEPAVASRARQGDFVKCLDHFDLLQTARCDPLTERRCKLPGKSQGQLAL
jgi:hypothetical protein